MYNGTRIAMAYTTCRWRPEWNYAGEHERTLIPSFTHLRLGRLGDSLSVGTVYRGFSVKIELQRTGFIKKADSFIDQV